MKMTLGRYSIAAVLAAAVLAAPAVAQNARVNSADAPVMWGGDVFTYRPNGVTLEGRAELLQGDNRMRANRLNLTTNGEGDLTRIEASDDVYYVTPRETMRGDSAVYDPSNDTVVITGDVILTQGENVMTGGRLTYNVRTETAQMAGGGANGRVQGVFYPQRSGQ